MQEKLIESCEASRVRRNLSIVDDEELEKRKESRIPRNTRINTSLAVRVWREWVEERNEMVEIIGDSGTLPKVNPDIVNITENDELNYWLSKLIVDVRNKKDRGVFTHPSLFINFAVVFSDICETTVGLS